jgi:hypothetical protein
MSEYLMTDSPIRFVFPINGDCVNERDGNKTEKGIAVRVKVKAPAFHEVYICGERADFEERVLHPCRLLAENGYKGAHISEVSGEVTK